jgi:hypothetical protein
MIVTACMKRAMALLTATAQFLVHRLAHLQALAASARYERRLTFFFVVKQDS